MGKCTMQAQQAELSRCTRCDGRSVWTLWPSSSNEVLTASISGSSHQCESSSSSRFVLHCHSFEVDHMPPHSLCKVTSA